MVADVRAAEEVRREQRLLQLALLRRPALVRGQVQQPVRGDRAGVRRVGVVELEADRGSHAVGARHQLAGTRNVGAELLRQ